MIQSLRRRFILITTAALAAALVCITAAINLGQYFLTTNQVDEIIQLIWENDNEMPLGLLHPEFSPETAYETRYFVVRFNANGQLDYINTNHVAALTEEGALNQVVDILEGGKSQGYISHYRYGVYTTAYGRSVIAVDCYSRLQSCRTLLEVTALAAVALLGIVVLILLLTSRRVVSPFVENYEKQRRFITDAGHELKTPLTIISANADVLEMTEGKSEWTQSIKDQVGRMNRLVRSLIELSRADELSQERTVREFDLSELAGQSAESFHILADQRGLCLETEIEPGLRYTGDPDEILRLLGILLDNALKYADPGSTISLGLRGAKRRRILTVRNFCAGLDPNTLPHLFDRFYRADKSRSRESGGYGIGLSIAQSIVRRAKGKISVSGENGVITFTVEL